MKLFAAILLMLLATASFPAEIPNLGVVSPKRAVALNADSLRPGFQHFLVEVRSESSPTNIVMITKTNDLLTAADMVQVPSGPGILGIRSVYLDSESEIALYRYDLRRSAPSKPSARPIHVLSGPEPEKSLRSSLERKKAVPPAPPLPIGRTNMVFAVPYHRPLPGATNRSYAEHWDWMSQRAAQGKRRNE